jgi:hypothetical protein
MVPRQNYIQKTAERGSQIVSYYSGTAKYNEKFVVSRMGPKLTSSDLDSRSTHIESTGIGNETW